MTSIKVTNYDPTKTYPTVFPGPLGIQEVLYQDQLNLEAEYRLGTRRSARVPDGKVLVSRGALAMVLNALDRDAAEGRVIRGEMAQELRESME